MSINLFRQQQFARLPPQANRWRASSILRLRTISRKSDCTKAAESSSRYHKPLRLLRWKKKLVRHLQCELSRRSQKVSTTDPLHEKERTEATGGGGYPGMPRQKSGRTLHSRNG